MGWKNICTTVCFVSEICFKFWKSYNRICFFFLDFQVSDRIDAITDDMADLETNDDINANDAFDAIAKQSEAAETKAIETGIFLLMIDQ